MTTSAAGVHFILGAGAQGRVVLEAWRAQHPGATFAFLDDNLALAGQEILGVPVRGGLALLAGVAGEVVLALGHNPGRLEQARRLATSSVTFGRPIHPAAAVAPSAAIGPGTVVLAGAVINSGAAIGAHVIVNTGVIVEHDSIVEDGASLSPAVAMGGRVRVGQGAFVAVGATLAPRVQVGAGAIVGAGAVVMTDVPPGTLVYGVPARAIRPVGPDDWKRVL